MRQPLAAYFDLEEPRPDVVVGDDGGNSVEAGWSEDDGWVSLADPTAPDVLWFEPKWFEVMPARG